MDLISVIVPVYNVEKYLDRCIRSIVDQTYENLEIILVDDGSPDNCGAICDAWAEKDSRIKVIHKENGGLSDARNAGMAVAQGEYIAFVDSDDWIHREYISAMYYPLTDTDGEIAACDVCFTAEYTQEEPCTDPASIRICTPEEAIEDITKGKGFRAVAWNKLYKKSLLEGECFPAGRHHEDEFFTYRILGKANRLVFVEKPLYYYFQRSGSIMDTFSMKRLDAFDAYLERLAYLKERYPRIYVQDKVQFCISCAMFYKEALTRKAPEMPQIRKKLIRYRKKISFKMRELDNCSARQLLYILGTGCCMDAFCKFINTHQRRQ